jgi:choline-sulfatase
VTLWKDPLPPGALTASGVRTNSDAPTTMLFPAGGDRKGGVDYPMVQLAIKVLERREADRPFCIFLPLLQPHPPYVAPREFVDLYDPAKLPPLAPPGLPRKPIYHAAIRQALKLDHVDDATLRKVRATYYGQVSYSDWMLGELMEAIERTGHAGDTALFVASDHGDYAGDYGLVEKWPSGLETCLTHVPLIARVPGGKPGVVAPDMVELYDIMATFLELAGTKATHTNFARSLTPQITGGPGDPDRAAFSEGGYNVYEPQAFEPRMAGLYGPKTNLQNDRPETIERAAAVKTQRYSYVERPGGVSELYDRKADPLEEHNLIDSRGHASVKEALQTRLLDWYINTTGVPGQNRDQRDMPAYVPNEAFPDAGKKAREILDR